MYRKKCKQCKQFFHKLKTHEDLFHGKVTIWFSSDGSDFREVVNVWYEGATYEGAWYSATITRVNEEGSFDVVYNETNEKEFRVFGDRIVPV